MGTLPISMRRTVPAEPKSIVAVARGPAPSALTTVPTPYLSWLTLSPAARTSPEAFPPSLAQPRNPV